MYYVFLSVLFTFYLNTAAAQFQKEYTEAHGGGSYTLPGVQCIDDDERALILLQNKVIIEELVLQRKVAKHFSEGPVLFDWPLRLADHADMYGYHGVSNFVDHDPEYPNKLLDYMGGTRTYDLANGYNHKGTDYFTWPFSWNMMDNDIVEVVAAAPGTILQRIDGNYDRNCSFGAGQWNAVYILHDDGSQAWYGHLKEGSVTGKGIGERVERGEYLGVVGSSGNSTGPHLHLEVYDADNNLIDPYEGPYNSMNETSWWNDQRPYYDSAINDLRTHFAPPEFRACPAPAIVNDTTHFDPGDTIYFVAYYRDQLGEHTSQFRVYHPNGSVWSSWSFSMQQNHFSASFWWWWRILPANNADGEWRFEIDYLGKTYSHTFYVGETTSVADDDITVQSYRLFQNYPNPFNPSTTIEYSLSEPGYVSITVYSLIGAEVGTLVDEYQSAGRHTVTFDADELPSGVYLYRIQANDFMETRRMVYLK